MSNGKALCEHLAKQGLIMPPEAACEIAAAVCGFLRDEMKREEPYAVKDIEALESAQMTIDIYLD